MTPRPTFPFGKIQISQTFADLPGGQGQSCNNRVSDIRSSPTNQIFFPVRLSFGCARTRSNTSNYREEREKDGQAIYREKQKRSVVELGSRYDKAVSKGKKMNIHLYKYCTWGRQTWKERLWVGYGHLWLNSMKTPTIFYGDHFHGQLARSKRPA